jgi:NAD(P)-dependent dehydrogenase (short-subunit alcohol dehydrogenase family)
VNPDTGERAAATIRRESGGGQRSASFLQAEQATVAGNRRLVEQVTVNLVHPGMAWTQMTPSMTSRTIPAFRLVWLLVRLVQRRRSPEKAGQQVASL